MIYLGITLKTTEWLLANSKLLAIFKSDLQRVINEKSIYQGVIAKGPLRITGVNNGLVCVWNNDYLSGTDSEDWGFVRLTGDLGVFTVDEIIDEVLDRCLYVLSIRLQGFNFPDDRLIHRSLKDNLHTCLSGRGEVARRSSIGWYEDKVVTKKGSFHSILIIGPSNAAGFDVISFNLNLSKSQLSKLIDGSNELLSTSRQRPMLESKLFEDFGRRAKGDIIKREDIPDGDKELDGTQIDGVERFATLGWSYEDWIKEGSPLTSQQREILESDVVLKQPLRIIGAAGTGKSLLMQLLALKRLNDARQNKEDCSILYVVHNSEMSNSIQEKFTSLGASDFLQTQSSQKLVIRTLFEYACEELNLDDTMIMDKDASQTKMFQRYMVAECIGEVLSNAPEFITKSDLIKKVSENWELRDVFADIVASEIGIGIKGRDLVNDKRKYVESERPFTRFHGILNRDERDFVFEIFTNYNRKVNSESGLLDSDDIAISFIGTLKTPLWGLRRKKLAYDFVFIDETQLFNQNERQIFRFLTKKTDTYLPIVIALDEAQEIRGSSNAGFGVLGIEHLADETLPNVHRSTAEILALAFFVIQRTTDLFGPDFPDFTATTTAVIKPQSHRVNKPKLIAKENMLLGQVIKKEISNLRRSGLRQIAVIIHPDRYLRDVVKLLSEEKENITVATKRGELIDPNKPIIYISRPDLIGGQEFDAVIVVGLEHGVTPPLVAGHAGLSETLEQQTLREIYLSFTRARFSLTIVNSYNSTPTGIIQEAIKEGYIEVEK